MGEPEFLNLEKVVRLHQSLLEAYGGTEGTRDTGLLESAASMPKASYGGQYLHGDLFEMAAAYLFHIVQNHPFLDGNKRTGAASAIVFLAINDIHIENDEEGLYDLTISVATGQAGKEQIANWFRQHAT